MEIRKIPERQMKSKENKKTIVEKARKSRIVEKTRTNLETNRNEERRMENIKEKLEQV